MNESTSLPVLWVAAPSELRRAWKGASHYRKREPLSSSHAALYNPPMPDHDSDYKLLFAHPEMVRDLIRDWVPGDWVAEADFSTLERINASYVAESQKQRHDDMVWRVRLRDRWLWLYLVLEFQSEPDPWMALRLLVYVGLLAQDLVKQDELADGRLPPILPLVLYNGLPPWPAATEVSELFAPVPAGLDAYRPRLRYHLIDEARLQLHPDEPVRTAVDALFRLEHSRSPEDLRRVVLATARLLNDPAQAPLRRTLTLWIRRLLRRKAGVGTIEILIDPLENDTMLAERIETWFAEAHREGVLQGLAQGEARGRMEGRMEGEAQLLAHLLERRFGPLPAAVAERLGEASESELEAWAEALLTADSLDGVFAARGH
ncbi:Rpn family recombination-promoting nuclease/putative transposase [Accumulibacter sp.]|uniref:Rpn family recombination-promoting nuclease/putative transposase n=1 Tax=Accumulibacter sp. TaxID=2053492 RepID=UPI00258A8094|nr:Rpn family recombination-promoting nuclease/putative transposase [Accumulibacter sp.]